MDTRIQEQGKNQPAKSENRMKTALHANRRRTMLAKYDRILEEFFALETINEQVLRQLRDPHYAIALVNAWRERFGG